MFGLIIIMFTEKWGFVRRVEYRWKFDVLQVD
jgi:hypothetical protein